MNMRETESSAAGGWDVLVVDDEPVVGAAIRRILGAAGLRGGVARGAGPALAHPAPAACRLVLCDLMLPDRPGTELISGIHSTRPELPVVAITGYATTVQNVRAMEAGASDFLAKPFDEQELLAVVRRMLRADRSEKE